MRHVNDKKTNVYWNHCYNQIIKFYPDVLIVIIDDNSKIKPKRMGKKLENILIIESEFPPQRGELLPYYYFFKKKFSQNTIFIHDSVFIHKKIDDKYLYCKYYNFLWNFSHEWDNTIETDLIVVLNKFDNNDALLKLYNNNTLWEGAFGCMTAMNLNFIEKVFNNTNYFNILIQEINCRHRRSTFERIIGVLFYYYENKISIVFDRITKYFIWGQTFLQYWKKKDKKDIEKIWTGR